MYFSLFFHSRYYRRHIFTERALRTFISYILNYNKLLIVVLKVTGIYEIYLL